MKKDVRGPDYVLYCTIPKKIGHEAAPLEFQPKGVTLIIQDAIVA